MSLLTDSKEPDARLRGHDSLKVGFAKGNPTPCRLLGSLGLSTASLRVVPQANLLRRLFGGLSPPYELGEILVLGLRQIKMQQALVLFGEAGVSLWKAARMAGVSLREMTQYAVSRGLRAACDEKTLEEDLV